MRRIFLVLALLVAASTPAIPLGVLTLQNDGMQWVLTKPDGSAISIVQSTYGWPESLSYKVANKLPLQAFGLGEDTPFSFTGYTLAIPAESGGNVKCIGCVFTFDNTSQAGILFDDQSYGMWDNEGGQVRYTGTSCAVGVHPTTTTTSPGGLTTLWGRHFIYKLGTLFAMSDTYKPAAMLCLLADTQNANAYLAGQIVLNHFKFGVECYGRAGYGVLLNSPPSNNNVIAENVFEFSDIEACTTAEIKIGNGGTHDNGLGTNIWQGGNIAHQGGGSSLLIDTNAPDDIFRLNAANSYSGNPSYLFHFGPNAKCNDIQVHQADGYGTARTHDENTSSCPNLVSTNIQ